jgi:hypothetical protein
VIGATLSRWTMSYFAAALVALVAAEGLMAAGFGASEAGIQAPDTLALVHLVTIGWLSLAMCGALFQFVPVLTARPLYSERLPLPTLICLLVGLAALLLGFLRLGGHVSIDLPFLATGGCLLGVGFGLALWNLGLTLWKARPLQLPARFVAVGLVCLAATAVLGIIFAFVLGGATANAHLLSVAKDGLPIHVVAGIGGWLTLTAAGVSYRLLAMFMLAPELDRTGSRAALWLGTIAISVTVAGGVTAICVGGSLGTVLTVAALFALAALALYGRDILYLYRARKRRALELNTRMAGFAFAGLTAAAMLSVALVVFGKFSDHVDAVVFLLAFGWLSGLVLAKLYKIVAFLTWLECYGPVLGKTPTPRVQDLVAEHRASKWFWLYFGAVWIGTAALLADAPAVFRVAAVLMAVATCGIAVQVVKTRRLSNVAAALRLPAGAAMPPLLFSMPGRS